MYIDGVSAIIDKDSFRYHFEVKPYGYGEMRTAIVNLKLKLGRKAEKG